MFIEERGLNYITYLSVYIARGIEAVTDGPCWSVANGLHSPSEEQLEAETFLSEKAKNIMLT